MHYFIAYSFCSLSSTLIGEAGLSTGFCLYEL